MEALRYTPRCNPLEPCSHLAIIQRLKAKNPHSGPEKACMACTAEDIIGGGSVLTVPVNQVVDRGLGEAVEGAAHRLQAIRAAFSLWSRLQRLGERHKQR